MGPPESTRPQNSKVIQSLDDGRDRNNGTGAAITSGGQARATNPFHHTQLDGQPDSSGPRIRDQYPDALRGSSRLSLTAVNELHDFRSR